MDYSSSLNMLRMSLQGQDAAPTENVRGIPSIFIAAPNPSWSNMPSIPEATNIPAIGDTLLTGFL